MTGHVPGERSLVLRLAGPLQSWGGNSQFNRRESLGEPTKSGITGLLAAAQGRRRQDSIEDLLALRLGVRTDQPGSLLRDYHTVSDYRGRRLLSAALSGNGTQKPTSPAKYTYVTQRFYLQDAIFVAAVSGPAEVLAVLHDAIRRPAFPLALGRRACVPTQPLLLDPTADQVGEHSGLWKGDPLAVLEQVPWQALTIRPRGRYQRTPPPIVDLPVTVDEPTGDDVRPDLPRSFDPQSRAFTTRRVRQCWVRIVTPFTGATDDHDPFALLGW
jgi:CRISPR system Cascade subunit CasD